MEAKLQKELKALASSSRSNAAMKLAARNVVDARKSKERMLATKARLNSVSMSLASQVRARRGGETCDGWEGNFFFFRGGNQESTADLLLISIPRGDMLPSKLPKSIRSRLTR